MNRKLVGIGLMTLLAGCGSPSGTSKDNTAATGGVSNGGQSGTGGGATSSGGSAGAAVGGNAGANAGGAAARFTHPGILVSRPMLELVKSKIAAGDEPWTTALARAQASSSGSLSYMPHAWATVECGSYSNPDNGCTDEKNDATAAYTHALLWFYTGDSAHANKAVEIMNAWSSTITEHTNSNAPLQSAWAAEVFPRAAEIIRSTSSSWAAADAERFATMLSNVYLPLIIDGSSANGNWELSMIEGVMNIGIFTDDETTFDRGVTMWRERVPAYVYLSSDGATPVPPPRGSKTGAALVTFWYDQTTYVDGLCQETCRDLGHVQYGLAALVNAAETARIQGVDLYAEESVRIRAMLEFHASYLDGATVPNWLCGGTLNAVTPDPTWEIALNHYGTTLGNTLPETAQLVGTIRPTRTDHHMDWETLTHGDIGGVGLP